MSCTMANRIARILLAGMLCLLVVHVWAAPPVAMNYAKPKRTFRVCLLLLYSQMKTRNAGEPEVHYWNPDPWILPVLNHSPYKPAGWEMENPLAPGVILPDSELQLSGQYYGMDAKGGNTAANSWYLNKKALNAPLTKDDPAYWVVKLDEKSLDALASFDLLILNGHSSSTLDNQDKNYLRLLLERGATILVNNSQRTGIQVNNFFIDPQIVFRADSFWYRDTNGRRLLKADPDHWLLNGHYKITDDEVNYLRDNYSWKSYIMRGVSGYAFDTAGNWVPDSSMVREVVRLSPAFADAQFPLNYAPAIAAGRVGRGLVIISGTDQCGAVADWWEYRHNRPGQFPNFDLSVWPSTDAIGASGPDADPSKPNRHRTYIASCKLFYNMLDRPANWQMAGADAAGSREYDRTFATTLSRGWTSGFTTLCDPVSFNDYVAVTGPQNGVGNSPNELRVYRTRRLLDEDGAVLDYPYGLYDEYGRKLTPALLTKTQRAAAFPAAKYPDDATPDSEMDRCLTLATNGRWVGSPVFGEVTQTITKVDSLGNLRSEPITRTVLYVLQEANDGAGTYCQPLCYALDPVIMRPDIASNGQPQVVPQVGELLWAGPSIPNFATASMTLSNGRLVVTTFGDPTPQSPMRIFMLDGKTGELFVQLGASAEWTAAFRLTSPASIIAAQMEHEATDIEAGVRASTTNNSVYNPNAPELRRDTVEMLAVTGEFVSQGGQAVSQQQQQQVPQGTSQSALFLIPPTVVIKLTPPRMPLPRLPADARLIGSPGPGGQRGVINLGDLGDVLRQKNILSVKVSGNIIKVTFRNWDAFFPQGTSTEPLLRLPLSLEYTPETTGTPRPGQATYERISNLALSMGYPITLRGTLYYDLTGRTALRVTDTNGAGTVAYRVDTPPTVYRDQVVIGTNTPSPDLWPTIFPTLQHSAEMLVPRRVCPGGALNGIRLKHAGLSASGTPSNFPSIGEMVWQFHGDTFGPKSVAMQQYIWRSDFPFAPALGNDTIFTTALYNGFGDYYGDTYVDFPDPAVPLRPRNYGADVPRGTLYAVNPAPARYLMQVVSAGTVTGVDGADPRRITVTPSQLIGTLKTGARVMLSKPGATPFTWDMGRITLIRKVDAFDPLNPRYWVTCDRLGPDAGNAAGCLLLTATAIPHLSHVRAWNAVKGGETVRDYQLDNMNVTRISEGVCGTPPDNGSANPDPRIGPQEVMIDVSDLTDTCHLPTVVNPATGTLALNDLSANFTPLANPTGWKQQDHLYLPRIPLVNGTNTVTGAPELNFSVDYRTGRVELNPRIAGELADRFLAVHYYTAELVNGNAVKVLHAELMYVPSLVKWQYQFTDALPDSGPAVVNDIVYVTAIRKTNSKEWQPVLYAFAANPQDPQNVQPLWVQMLDAGVPETTPWPYRAVTSPTPTTHGVLVGTALLGSPTQELALFSDRGTLIADGQRLLRIDSDGQVTWQASATTDFDPNALQASGMVAQAGMVQQGFTLVTRMQHLPGGNLLLCDTGANRVVEMNREGAVVWQYPDSDLTYQDPDRQGNGANLRSDAQLKALRVVTPRDQRINGPRDMRRYTKDVTVTNVRWGATNYGPATIRWEITLIADTGNNRIIEILRPLVRLENLDALNQNPAVALAPGFCYRPDLTYQYNGTDIKLVQQTVVVADGASLAYEGGAFPNILSFLLAVRYTGADNALVATQDDADPVMKDVRTKEVLAVVANPVSDLLQQGQLLRTVRLTKADNTPTTKAEVLKHPLLNSINALAVRAASPYDYARVRQLDLITLRREAGGEEVHALVVDQAGVREVSLDPAAQALPLFEMNQAVYADAMVNDTYWEDYVVKQRFPLLSDLERQPLEDKIIAWKTDSLFSPVAALRLDPNNGTIPANAAQAQAYYQKVRYRIMQMNATASPNDKTWMNGKAERRIHLFDARWVNTRTAWGIVDDGINYFVYPDPLSSNFPVLPGWSYPLTQPLALALD